jgi:hypothetical protein
MRVQAIKQTAPDDSARDELAAAIAAAAEAEHAFNEANNAVRNARTRLWATNADLEDLCQALPKIDSDVAVAAAASGDIGVLERTQTERQNVIARARFEVEVWQVALNAAVAAVSTREHAFNAARQKVDMAVRGVVATSDVTATLLDGLSEMQDKVFSRRLALHFLDMHGLLPPAHEVAVRAALAPFPLPGDRRQVYFDSWLTLPPYAAWMRAVDALRRDANTPLPTVAT